MALHGGGVQRCEVVVPSGTRVRLDWGRKQKPNSLNVARRRCQVERGQFDRVIVQTNECRTVRRHQLFERCNVAGCGRALYRFLNLVCLNYIHSPKIKLQPLSDAEERLVFYV
jgi:hypothetical protein